MKEKCIRLIYLALGSFMLVILQTPPFQNALGFSHLVTIHLGDIIFQITHLLSFIGAIIFIYSSIKLILINLKNN